MAVTVGSGGGSTQRGRQRSTARSLQSIRATQNRKAAGQTWKNPAPRNMRTIAGALKSSPAPSAGASTAAHTVHSGQNLTQIAKQMGVTVAALAKHNNISNPNVISVGQVIRNPRASAEAAAKRHSDALARSKAAVGGHRKTTAAGLAAVAAKAKSAKAPVVRAPVTKTPVVRAPVKAAVKAPVVKAPVKAPVVSKPVAPAPVVNKGTQGNVGTFTNRGKGGTFGRFQRQRRNRGPRSGTSMTQEMLRRLALERVSSR